MARAWGTQDTMQGCQGVLPVISRPAWRVLEEEPLGLHVQSEEKEILGTRQGA